MPRVTAPEILDHLPVDHPAAQRSRRDLRLTNALMGNHRWIVRELRRGVRHGEAVLEVGAGDGALARQGHAVGFAIDALDQSCPAPADWPPSRTWYVGDLRQFPDYETYPVIVANLVLHHLSDGELGLLGATWRRHARVILACEPARRRSSAWLFAGLGRLLQADPVTLHDARVSIAAGFRGRELPALLGLGTGWRVRCHATALGAYRLVATRQP